MKKNFAILITTILIFAFSTTAAHAGGGAIIPPFAGDINDLISRVTFLLRPFFLISFLAMMIYGGYVRMTAAGNADAEAQSTKILTAAIIGFAIVALSPIILSVAQQVIGIPSII